MSHDGGYEDSVLIEALSENIINLEACDDTEEALRLVISCFESLDTYQKQVLVRNQCKRSLECVAITELVLIGILYMRYAAPDSFDSTPDCAVIGFLPCIYPVKPAQTLAKELLFADDMVTSSVYVRGLVACLVLGLIHCADARYETVEGVDRKKVAAVALDALNTVLPTLPGVLRRSLAGTFNCSWFRSVPEQLFFDSIAIALSLGARANLGVTESQSLLQSVAIVAAADYHTLSVLGRQMERLSGSQSSRASAPADVLACAVLQAIARPHCVVDASVAPFVTLSHVFGVAMSTFPADCAPLSAFVLEFSDLPPARPLLLDLLSSLPAFTVPMCTGISRAASTPNTLPTDTSLCPLQVDLSGAHYYCDASSRATVAHEVNALRIIRLICVNGVLPQLAWVGSSGAVCDGGTRAAALCVALQLHLVSVDTLEDTGEAVVGGTRFSLSEIAVNDLESASDDALARLFAALDAFASGGPSARSAVASLLGGSKLLARYSAGPVLQRLTAFSWALQLAASLGDELHYCLRRLLQPLEALPPGQLGAAFGALQDSASIHAAARVVRVLQLPTVHEMTKSTAVAELSATALALSQAVVISDIARLDVGLQLIHRPPQSEDCAVCRAVTAAAARLDLYRALEPGLLAGAQGALCACVSALLPEHALMLPLADAGVSSDARALVAELTTLAARDDAPQQCIRDLGLALVSSDQPLVSLRVAGLALLAGARAADGLAHEAADTAATGALALALTLLYKDDAPTIGVACSLAADAAASGQRRFFARESDETPIDLAAGVVLEALALLVRKCSKSVQSHVLSCADRFLVPLALRRLSVGATGYTLAGVLRLVLAGEPSALMQRWLWALCGRLTSRLIEAALPAGAGQLLGLAPARRTPRFQVEDEEHAVLPLETAAAASASLVYAGAACSDLALAGTVSTLCVVAEHLVSRLESGENAAPRDLQNALASFAVTALAQQPQYLRRAAQVVLRTSPSEETTRHLLGAVADSLAAAGPHEPPLDTNDVMTHVARCVRARAGKLGTGLEAGGACGHWVEMTARRMCDQLSVLVGLTPVEAAARLRKSLAEWEPAQATEALARCVCGLCSLLARAEITKSFDAHDVCAAVAHLAPHMSAAMVPALVADLCRQSAADPTCALVALARHWQRCADLAPAACSEFLSTEQLPALQALATLARGTEVPARAARVALGYLSSLGTVTRAQLYECGSGRPTQKYQRATAAFAALMVAGLRGCIDPLLAQELLQVVRRLSGLGPEPCSVRSVALWAAGLRALGASVAVRAPFAEEAARVAATSLQSAVASLSGVSISSTLLHPPVDGVAQAADTEWADRVASHYPHKNTGMLALDHALSSDGAGSRRVGLVILPVTGDEGSSSAKRAGSSARVLVGLVEASVFVLHRVAELGIPIFSSPERRGVTDVPLSVLKDAADMLRGAAEGSAPSILSTAQIVGLTVRVGALALSAMGQLQCMNFDALAGDADFSLTCRLHRTEVDVDGNILHQYRLQTEQRTVFDAICACIGAVGNLCNRLISSSELCVSSVDVQNLHSLYAAFQLEDTMARLPASASR